MLLGEVKEGTKVKVKNIRAGLMLRKRLADMGIIEGQIVEVINNNFTGPMLLKIMDSRIALGRGQVLKIEVEVLKNYG